MCILCVEVSRTSVFRQSTRAYECKCPANGRLSTGHPGHIIMGEEEGQLSGCHLVGVTRMHCIHLNVCTILGAQAAIQRGEMELVVLE